jgi:hypothetical protein
VFRQPPPSSLKGKALNFSDILEGIVAGLFLVIIAGFLAYLVEKLNR